MFYEERFTDENGWEHRGTPTGEWRPGRLDFSATPTPQAEAGDRPKGFGIACTCAWTELYQAMKADGMNPPEKCGPATRAWIVALVEREFALPQAPARDAGAVALSAVAWRVEFECGGFALGLAFDTKDDANGYVRARSKGPRKPEFEASNFRVRPLIYGDTHPAAASDDARDAALELARREVERLTAALVREESMHTATMREAATIREAAESLLDKINVIHADERYQGVWLMAHNHGMPYTGPNYLAELTELVAALSSPDGLRKGEGAT